MPIASRQFAVFGGRRQTIQSQSESCWPARRRDCLLSGWQVSCSLFCMIWVQELLGETFLSWAELNWVQRGQHLKRLFELNANRIINSQRDLKGGWKRTSLKHNTKLKPQRMPTCVSEPASEQDRYILKFRPTIGANLAGEGSRIWCPNSARISSDLCLLQTGSLESSEVLKWSSLRSCAVNKTHWFHLSDSILPFSYRLVSCCRFIIYSAFVCALDRGLQQQQQQTG